MSKIKCKLLCHSLSPHLRQLYTGFHLLYKKGLIELEQQWVQIDSIDKSKPQYLEDARHAHLSVIINNTVKLHYDTHDAVEIHEEYLAKNDFYFKRSFSRNYIATLSKHQNKLFPLGLNYWVLPDEFDYFAFQRLWHLNINNRQKPWLSSLIDIIDTHNLVKDNPRLRQLESLPDYDSPPRVLFLVTAYDPFDNPDRSEEKIAERIHINETRARCIKLLRQELGNRFLGGFNHKTFTQQHYKDLMVADNNLTLKGNYLKTLKSYPICIATTGLHGSIGWKMAEYVSLSKAIVSEKLNYEVPGNFQKGSHYLEFTTPEECVELSLKLIGNRQLRNELMTNNALYYQANLKPDILVLNTLLTALKDTRHNRFSNNELLFFQPDSNINRYCS